MTWFDLARAQYGAISRGQLADHGLATWTVDDLIESGRLAPHGRAVFLVGGAPLTYRARLWIAMLATGGVLGFATAARLWGVVEEPISGASIDDVTDRVHVVVPHSRRIYPPRWVRVHRVPLPSLHVTTRDELAMTKLPWTVFDHLTTLPRGEAARLADRALQRQWISSDDLEQRIRNHPGRHGNRLLRSLQLLTTDGAAAESERRLHRLLKSAQIRDWTPNYAVWADGELVAVIDLAIPAQRLAIEVDGMAYHIDVDRFQRDRTRQNQLVTLGWTVLRFTWADLTERPAWVISTIQNNLGSLSRPMYG